MTPRRVSPNAELLLFFILLILFVWPAKNSGAQQGQEDTPLSFAGEYDFTAQTLHGHLSLKEIDLTRYQACLKTLPFDLEAGSISLLEADYSLDAKTIKISSELSLAGLRAKKDNLECSNVYADSRNLLEISLSEGKVYAVSAQGSLKIKKGDISGIQKIEKINAFSAELSFKNTDIIMENASGLVLETPVTGRGSFKDNTLTLEIKGDFDVNKLLFLLPEEIDRETLKTAGKTKLSLRILYPQPEVAGISINGEAVFNGLKLNLPQNNLTFFADKGTLSFDTKEEVLVWHFDAVEYLKQRYSFDGRLKNFFAPAVAAMVTGQDLKVRAQFTKNGSQLVFSSLQGRYKKSEFNLQGRLDQNVTMEAGGIILLDLTDIKTAGLLGRARLAIEAKGPLWDYRRWRLKAQGKSVLIQGRGLKIQDVNLDYNQINGQGFINKLSFDTYAGAGSFRGRINLLEDKNAFALRGELKNIDLNLLKSDTDLKDKVFFGTFAAAVSIQGQARDLESLKGEGNFNIRNGNIWEFNPLKGLGNFLFIPRLTNIEFTTAQGDFSIGQGRVSTDNLEMLGPQMGLLVEGSIAFKGELDLLVNTQLPQPGPKALQQALGTVSRAGSLTAIKITGTLQKPKYKLQPIAENIMKKLGDILSAVTP